MQDVFKYLRRADSYIREAKEESQGHKQAVQAGGVTSSYGRYYDKDGKYIGKVVGDKWQPTKADDMLARTAGSETGKATETESQPKTLDQFRQSADQSQMNRVVPGGPTSTTLASGDKEKTVAQLSRGRSGVQSDKRKAQIQRQADRMLAVAGNAQEVEPEQTPTKSESPPPKEIDDLVNDTQFDVDEEDEFDDEQDRIFKEIEDYYTDTQMKDVTDRIRKNMEKKFESFRKALGTISAGGGRKSFLKSIAHAKTFEGRINAGAGKNNLGYADIQNLMANRDRLIEGYGDGSPETIKKFVKSVRSNPVSDEFVDASFDVLPASFQKSLSGKGQVTNDAYVSDDKAHKDIHYLGKNEDGTIRRGQASSKDRAKLMWRIYLEQGGRDAYTGLPLDLQAMDLEHVRGFNNKDDGKPGKEEWEQRENNDNMTLINSNINQKKVDLSMKDFFEREVDPHKDKSEEDFGGIEKLFEKQNEIGNVASELVKTLLGEGGKGLGDGVTPDILAEHFDDDDKRYTDLRDEFRKASTDKKTRAKADQMKSKIGKQLLKATGLARGIQTPDGRRTVSLNENLYRGFLRSMANAKPEDRQKYMDGWAEAIRAGNTVRNQSGVVSKLLELDLIDDSILSDKKAGRVFKEEFSQRKVRKFIRKFHKQNKYF